MLRPTKRLPLWALPILLMIAVAPTPAVAQPHACYAIQRGDTATQLARRLTGNSQNKYQDWFQILDLESRVVPKSQYARIRAGWRACIVNEAVESRALQPVRFETRAVVSAPLERAGTATPVQSLQPLARFESLLPAVTGALRSIGGVDLSLVLFGAVVAFAWSGWRLFEGYLDRRRTMSIVMRHFAYRFVHEFERPLIQQPGTQRPVRSRLRCHPRRGQLDILIAPGQGRRYPNLSDHRKNVEYDVVRVTRVLADGSFVRGPLYTHAGWVVVPFQFKAGSKQAGVTCISSF